MKLAIFLKKAAPVIMSFMVLAIASIYFMQRILKHERKIAGIRTLYRIHKAQEQFKAVKGGYTTLSELEEAGLLKSRPTSQNSDFKYWLSDLTPTTFCAHADRISYNTGDYDFNLSEDGVLYSQRSKILGSVPRGQGIVGQR